MRHKMLRSKLHPSQKTSENNTHDRNGVDSNTANESPSTNGKHRTTPAIVAVDVQCSAPNRSEKRRSKHGFTHSSISHATSNADAVEHEAVHDMLQRPPKRARKDLEPGSRAVRGNLVGRYAKAPVSGTARHESTDPSPDLQFLKPKYEVTMLSIISSSSMEQKVKLILKNLSDQPTGGLSKKPILVALRAKASTSGKLIAIVEIAKKEIAKSRSRWWQYSKLEGIVQAISKDATRRSSGNDANNDMQDAARGHSSGHSSTEYSAVDSNNSKANGVGDEDDDETETEGFFETMPKTQRSREGKGRLRNIPALTIFLAKTQVPDLKARYGEQTNK